MKKTMLLLGALMLSAAASYAQESRQDVSISATADFAPDINGGTGVHKSTTTTLGGLASYRYMLTPRSALEANYAYAQNSQKYITSHVPDGRIHTLQQEVSVAYVYNLNFKRFTPFAEAGVGGMIFSPVLDSGTNQLDAKRNTSIGGLFGAGVAYELSPSFDIRAEYRGFVVKTPSFGLPGDIFQTNRYEVVSTPSLGIAYHF